MTALTHGSAAAFEVSMPRRRARGRGRRHQLPRRAEAALRGVVIDEGLLQRAQPAVACETLDGLDRPAIGPHRQLAAGVDGTAVEQHRAGAAFTAIAADLGPGEADV